jgi:hypothetical protein
MILIFARAPIPACLGAQKAVFGDQNTLWGENFV